MFTPLFRRCMINFKNIYRNRLFIIGLHIVAWTCFLLLPFFIYRLRILHPWFFTREIIDNLFLIGVFYLNIYVLIPRFFTLKKIVYYFGCVILVLIFITLQQSVMDHLFMRYLASHEVELNLPGSAVDSTGKVTLIPGRTFMRYRAFAGGDNAVAAAPRLRIYSPNGRLIAGPPPPRDSEGTLSLGQPVWPYLWGRRLSGNGCCSPKCCGSRCWPHC